jgi:hypothetical protein
MASWIDIWSATGPVLLFTVRVIAAAIVVVLSAKNNVSVNVTVNEITLSLPIKLFCPLKPGYLYVLSVPLNAIKKLGNERKLICITKLKILKIKEFIPIKRPVSYYGSHHIRTFSLYL